MTNTDKTINVFALFASHVNKSYEVNKQLAINWRKFGNEERSEFDYQKQLAYAIVSDTVDAIIHDAFVNYGITCDIVIGSESFIWKIQSRIAKLIDSVASYGYAYIMHSYKLKAQYEVYTECYEVLELFADECGVFMGYMH